MLRTELTDRVGVLEDWQWEMAHYVYQNHKDIKDVGGKDQIANIIKLGWEPKHWGGIVIIRQMYKEINGPPIIKYQQDTLFSTYDVTIDNYCINEKPKTMQNVYQVIKDRFETQYKELADHADYFSVDTYENEYWPINTRLAVFYVRGGSEGYYVHIESLSNGKNRYLCLIKTLLEDETGRKWAEQTANALSRILEV